MNADVFCKLHTLLHYPETVRQFGPLKQFSAFYFETKHQEGKAIARSMHNWVAPAKTIHRHIQISRALFDKANNFYEFNYYPHLTRQQKNETIPQSVSRSEAKTIFREAKAHHPNFK